MYTTRPSERFIFFDGDITLLEVCPKEESLLWRFNGKASGTRAIQIEAVSEYRDPWGVAGISPSTQTLTELRH